MYSERAKKWSVRKKKARAQRVKEWKDKDKFRQRRMDQFMVDLLENQAEKDEYQRTGIQH